MRQVLSKDRLSGENYGAESLSEYLSDPRQLLNKIDYFLLDMAKRDGLLLTIFKKLFAAEQAAKKQENAPIEKAARDFLGFFISRTAALYGKPACIRVTDFVDSILADETQSAVYLARISQADKDVLLKKCAPLQKLLGLAVKSSEEKLGSQARKIDIHNLQAQYAEVSAALPPLVTDRPQNTTVPETETAEEELEPVELFEKLTGFCQAQGYQDKTAIQAQLKLLGRLFGVPEIHDYCAQLFENNTNSYNLLVRGLKEVLV